MHDRCARRSNASFSLVFFESLARKRRHVTNIIRDYLYLVGQALNLQAVVAEAVFSKLKPVVAGFSLTASYPSL
jgi:hypothetical protein